jgi:uncharacterized membrane protein
LILLNIAGEQRRKVGSSKPLEVFMRQPTAQETGNGLTYLMLGLAIVGIADASYESFAIYTGQALWCPPPIDGCNAVANSPYARISGMPLGYFGVLYYLGIAAIAAVLVFRPSSQALRSAAVAYATAGVLASIVFFYIQFNYIHAFCIYCMISALLTVLLAITSFMHNRRTREGIPAHAGRSSGLVEAP